MNYFGKITFVKDENRSTKDFGRFVIEPVANGSGRIFGNALRRMLMFTVPGCAILKVKFDDALHEFSSIPEVVEDVQEIIMNLRKVVFSMKEDTLIARIEKGGPCKVYAKDIKKVNTLEIANPDQYICTINEGGQLYCEIEIHQGQGYVTVEENQVHKENIGEIIMDTHYSPIRKASFKTEEFKDKEDEVYERLIFDIIGDGSVEIDWAMKEAMTTLSEYTQAFTNLVEYVEEIEEEVDEVASIDKTALPISELNLSVRSRNCLKYVDVKVVGDLTKYSAQELMEIKNFGKKSLVEIRQKLAELGLALKGEGIVDENYDAMQEESTEE